MFATRQFGAAVSALALAAFLLAAPARAAEVDKLLPNDTETVVAVNVKQILDSPLAKKLPLDKVKEAVKGQEDLQKTLTDLGFDPFKDLESIVAASPGGNDPERGLIIVRGKFDMAKFQAKAEEVAKDMKDKLKILEVPDGLGGKTKLYEVANQQGMPDKVYVAFAGKDAIVASPGKDYVLDAIDKQAGRKKTELKSKELKDLLGRVDAKYSIWTAVLGSTLQNSPLAQEDSAKEIVNKVQDVIAGVAIDKDLKVEVGITAKSTQDAKDLEAKVKEGLNQALGILALLAGNEKKLEPLIDVLKMVKPSLKDKTVTVQLKIDGEDIEKAIKDSDK
jgi:hypothetical protein